MSVDSIESSAQTIAPQTETLSNSEGRFSPESSTFNKHDLFSLRLRAFHPRPVARREFKPLLLEKGLRQTIERLNISFELELKLHEDELRAAECMLKKLEINKPGYNPYFPFSYSLEETLHSEAVIRILKIEREYLKVISLAEPLAKKTIELVDRCIEVRTASIEKNEAIVRRAQELGCPLQFSNKIPILVYDNRKEVEELLKNQRSFRY